MESVEFFLLTVSKFSAHRSPLASYRSHGSVVDEPSYEDEDEVGLEEDGHAQTY